MCLWVLSVMILQFGPSKWVLSLLLYLKCGSVFLPLGLSDFYTFNTKSYPWMLLKLVFHKFPWIRLATLMIYGSRIPRFFRVSPAKKWLSNTTLLRSKSKCRLCTIFPKNVRHFGVNIISWLSGYLEWVCCLPRLMNWDFVKFVSSPSTISQNPK